MAVRWWAAVAGLGPRGGSPSERTTAPGSTVGRTLRSDGGPSVGRPQKSAPPVRRRPADERWLPAACGWPAAGRFRLPRRFRLLPPALPPAPPARSGVTPPPRRRRRRPARLLRRWHRAAA